MSQINQDNLQNQTQKEDAYVQLAHQTIEEYVRTGKVIDVPGNLPPEPVSVLQMEEAEEDSVQDGA